MFSATKPTRILTLATALALLSSLSLATPETSVKAPAAAPHGLRLSADNFQKFLQVDQKVSGAMVRDKTMEASMALSGTKDTFDTWLRKLDANPQVKEALKAAGTTSRDYLRTLVSLLQASAVAAAKKQGKAVSPVLQHAVLVENVAFVESHWAEIEAWWKRSGTQAIQPNTMEDLYVGGSPSTGAAPSPGAAPSSGAKENDTNAKVPEKSAKSPRKP